MQIFYNTTQSQNSGLKCCLLGIKAVKTFEKSVQESAMVQKWCTCELTYAKEEMISFSFDFSSYLAQTTSHV